MKKLIVATLLLFSSIINSQKIRVDKIEPPNWWSGLENNIQLMVYGDNLTDFKATFNSPQIKIKKIHRLPNSSYAFLDITLANKIEPGNYRLKFSRGNENASVSFPIFSREDPSKRFKGFGTDDVIYLIVPDRFSDGDKSNNISERMINDFNSATANGRHGGDLQGIMNHFDYLKELGVNTLWLTPVLENNTSLSYHGYAATNLYKVDSRFGGNDKYKEFVNEAHKQNFKIIYDHVSNHISINHPWLKNPPMQDWINGTIENHLSAWHDKMVRWDTHAAQYTHDKVTKGWFVNEMPDLNQQNPFVKNYLIQNTIWWIEYAGLDGIREDTYPYADENFMSDWAAKILKLYPKFNIVGEVWTGEPSFLAPYQKGSKLNKGKDTNMPALTDFGLRDAYYDFLSGKSNVYSFFKIISTDFLYANPNGLLVFADNHDLQRAALSAQGNFEKVKLAFTHLFTSRGIPEIFYGTEIGMQGGKEDGLIRSNFPGGFNDGSSNCFTEAGRTPTENDLFKFFKKIIALRKEYKSLSHGSLIHLPPVENVYLYTKKLGNELMLIALNGNNTAKEIKMDLVEKLCGSGFKLKDLMNDSPVLIEDGKLLLPPMSGNIFEVKQ